ncbi:hypothetical protein BSM4216_3168 [Bacillus smithii]|nr:hypothetical protein BSM4216_3168 [Bacillus smithii]
MCFICIEKPLLQKKRCGLTKKTTVFIHFRLVQLASRKWQ